MTLPDDKERNVVGQCVTLCIYENYDDKKETFCQFPPNLYFFYFGLCDRFNVVLA